MYESPIDVFVKDVANKINQEQDKMIFEEIKRVGIHVDKNELLRALEYDRNQYDKGYKDGYYAGSLAWTPIEEELPPKPGDYLVTYQGGMVDIDWFNAQSEKFSLMHEHIIAWTELPRGYEA